MKFRNLFAVAFALLSASAVQAEPLSIPRNANIISSDGATLGKVDRVLIANDAVTGVQFILGSKMVVVPGDTLSVENGSVKTSLSRKEVRALK
ncbi:MAG: hypothetical protein ACSLE1_00535 [Sphingobium sp.]